MKDIRAIETEWNGYRFRSRTEARWAVFMDCLSVAYEYEVQGFELGGTRYLPDFWLPGDQAWMEIKGTAPTPEEDKKAELLCEGTRFPVFIFVGAPWFNIAERHFMWCEDDQRVIEVGFADCMTGYDWEKEGEYYQGVMAWMIEGAKERGTIGCLVEGCDSYAARHPKMVRAYREARGARFEFYPKNMRRVLEDGNVI